MSPQRRSTWTALRAVVSTVLMATMGCSHYVPVQNAPKRDERIRVRFSEPRTVKMSRTLGDSLQFAGVRQLGGSLVEMRADTILMSVWSMEGAHRIEMAAPPLGARTAIVAGQGVEITHLQINRKQTAAFVGVVVLVPVGFLVWLAHTLAMST